LLERGMQRRRALTRAQYRSLRPDRRLRNLVVGDRRVLLDLQLELEPSGVVEVLVELSELLDGVVLEGIRHVDVLALDLKSHRSLLVGLDRIYRMPAGSSTN